MLIISSSLSTLIDGYIMLTKIGEKKMMRFFSGKQPLEVDSEKLKRIRPTNFETGINCLFGLTGDENSEKAIKYLTKVTKSTHHDAGLAACCLGTAYLHGTGIVTPEAKQTAENVLSTGIKDGQDWRSTDEDQKACIIAICKYGCIKQDLKLAIQFFKLGVKKGEENASRMLEDAISYLEKVANTQEVSNASDEAQEKAAHLLYQYHSEKAEYYKNKYNILTNDQELVKEAFGALRAPYIIIKSQNEVIYSGSETEERKDGCSCYRYHSERAKQYQILLGESPQQILAESLGTCCVM